MNKCESCGQEIQEKSNLTDLRKVVLVYKMATGYPKEDKGWDKIFFRIYLPTAKKMIDFLGTWKAAADCIQDTFESIQDWNPEATISLQKIMSNHMAGWKQKRQEMEAKNGIYLSAGSRNHETQTGRTDKSSSDGEEIRPRLRAV